MTVEANDEPFWQQLRRSVQAAEQLEREELEAAERMLAETEVDAEDRLSPRQIAAMVERATAMSNAPDADDPGDRGGNSVPTEAEPAAASAAPVHRFVRLRRVLAAAAALMMAPKFLAAATVVTVVAVVSYVEIRYSTLSLPYQDAVRILMDERQSVASRESAQGRITGDLMESIGIMRAVTGEGGDIGEQARAALRRMRALLASADAFVTRRYSDDLIALGDELADNTLDVEQRQDALFRLSELMAYGMHALKEIERHSGPSGLKAKNMAVLLQLARLLD